MEVFWTKKWGCFSLTKTGAEGEGEFVFHPARSETKFRVKPKGLTKMELMGELGQFERLPIYQLSLPFNAVGLRQQEYAGDKAA